MNWAYRDGLRAWLEEAEKVPQVWWGSEGWIAGRRTAERLLRREAGPPEEFVERLGQIPFKKGMDLHFKRGWRQFGAELESQLLQFRKERVLWLKGDLRSGRDLVHVGDWNRVCGEASEGEIPFLLWSRWEGVMSRLQDKILVEVDLLEFREPS